MYIHKYSEKSGEQNMKPTERSLSSLLVLQYLQNETGSEKGAGISDIAAMLEEHGISADRRTIYSLLDSLRQAGYDVRMVHRQRSYTYYIGHDISAAEAFILLDAIRSSRVLSKKGRKNLTAKLCSLLSREENDLLSSSFAAGDAGSDTDLLQQISVLLSAIRRNAAVSFRYFDYNVRGEKVYRHNGEFYRLLPLRILSENSRYYCIFWSALHHHPLNFRIDKMVDAEITDEICEPVQFDLEGYMQKTFHMYTGDSEMVTAVFRNSMASILFDTFQKENIMINSCGDDTFTASIRTAVTPTLVSWFLQFYDRITVVRPQSLIRRLTEIAAATLENYSHEEQEKTDDRKQQD